MTATTVPDAAGDRRSMLVVVACAAALVAPLVVALVALRRPTWFPVLDLAMTELRVRDVGTERTPLIGLPGRIGRSLADQGSHPGPLSFYALAPAYRALGRGSWALQAGAVAVHGAAIVTALAIARRRGGTVLVVSVAAMLAVLTRGYGLAALTEPWNPYLPLLWWIVFLLAVWSVVTGDRRLLPVAVVAGSFCAQTHVPYLALTAGLGAVVMIAALASARDAEQRRSVLAWAGASIALGVLLWAPPLIDEVREERGNLTRLAEHFTSPPESPVGAAKGVELALLHLDVFSIAAGRDGTTGSLVTATAEPEGPVFPGIALLIVWIASAAAAWRMRPRADSVVALHVVVAAGLALGAVSISRIFGDLWFYLMLWAWGVTALLVLAVGWTVALALGGRVPANWSRAGRAGLAAVVAVSAASFALDAADAEPPAPRLSATLGAVTVPTASALRAGVGAADGDRGRYVITWNDALHIGSQAYGLVSELERRGFTVGMTPGLRVPNTKYRTIDPSDATAEVHFATGVHIEAWRARPEAVEVAAVEPRSAPEIRRFSRLRDEATRRLRAEGLDDVVPLVDTNLFGASIDRRVPSSTRELLAEMLELGLPAAVFIAPPGSTPS